MSKQLAKVETKKVPARRAAEPAPQPRPERAWSVGRPLAVGFVTLAILVGGFGSWAAFSEISGAVVASGAIEVERNRQVVQHPDGGVVAEILVDEGDEVDEGDVLVRLDRTILMQDLAAARSQLHEILARRARLEAERDGAEAIRFSEDLDAAAVEDPDVAEMMEGQVRLFEARADTADKSIAQLRGRKLQIDRQVEGVESQQAALKTQLGLIAEELADQQSLLDRGLSQAARVKALQREQADLQGRVGELVARAGEAAERISEIDSQILTYTTQRTEEAITELRDLSFREVEYRRSVETLTEQLGRTDIRAPVSGIVYGMNVFAERAVIRPADPVLFIIPQNRPLVIAAQVPLIHVDEVHVGQPAILRFSSFDARRTPELFGEVTNISADRFENEQTGQAFYRVELRLDEDELDRLPEGLVLIPGMPVEAYMRTADRTPIAYLVKPLADYFAGAMRES